MTLSEFKAWFEGFSEIMDGPPSEKQWERIKARVSEINGSATPYPVFIDRYVEPYRRYWPNVPYWAASSSGPLVGQVLSIETNTGARDFNSHSAMTDLGKAEYRAMLDA
ncbi:hypothetical protein [Rhizobium mesoamericanum]|uniref:hypothetical protein n=1 Tax=Rhizobium mesoamericanum TaxID=1079800 RepID=UPI00041E9D53|nr:hypothetical protein [Rhizobium mesoamericanum]